MLGSLLMDLVMGLEEEKSDLFFLPILLLVWFGL